MDFRANRLSRDADYRSLKKVRAPERGAGIKEPEGKHTMGIVPSSL